MNARWAEEKEARVPKKSRKNPPLPGLKPKAEKGKDKVPSWAKEPLDADKPLLPQLEEKCLQARSQSEFDQGLKWLRKSFYQNPQIRFLLDNMSFSGKTSDSAST